ncbi:MAG: hypothetical protein ACPLRH_02915 [Desulfotomaculales bacterium]
MAVMSEETKKEPVTEFPYRIASPEFFFLLQRIDRLDEKLTERIDQVRQDVAAAERRAGGLFKWALGLVGTSLALTLTTLGIAISLLLRLR